jgi:HSP20 family protein
MTLYISPYRRMAHFREAVNRLIDENYTEAQQERELALAVDVRAEDEAFQITALVPGIDPESLDIEILNNTVTLRGEFPSREEEAGYMLCELPAGRFTRSITLPTALDASKAEANIKNGVLTLLVPKAESHRPRSIKITAN